MTGILNNYKFVALLDAICDKHRDLNIGQVLTLAANKAGFEGREIYNCPDELLVKGMEAWREEEKPNGIKENKKSRQTA